MFWLLILPILVYGCGLIYVSLDYKRSLKQQINLYPEGSAVTVIVAARNEEVNIGNILKDLTRQQTQGFEVIVADDHSEDETAKIASSFQNVRVVLNEGHGKKAALATAIGKATGSIILVTDADCNINSRWVQTIAAGFQQSRIGMVCGPVRLTGKPGLLTQLQQLEFHSLILLGATFIRHQKPFFCNAACMGFRKELFYKVGGYFGNEMIPSGDDEFLMQKIHQHADIYFESNPDAMVTTNATKSLHDYIQQRVRWASKHNGYLELYKKWTIYLFGLVNLEILIFPLLIILIGPIAALLPLFKMMIDGAFAFRHAKYFNTNISIASLPLLVCCYPWLLLRISLQRKYVWKGRQLS